MLATAALAPGHPAWRDRGLEPHTDNMRLVQVQVPLRLHGLEGRYASSLWKVTVAVASLFDHSQGSQLWLRVVKDQGCDANLRR